MSSESHLSPQEELDSMLDEQIKELKELEQEVGTTEIAEVTEAPEVSAEEAAEAHRIHQEDIARRINTPADELLRQAPNERHTFFKPVRPKMLPLNRQAMPSATAEPLEEVADENILAGGRQAELLFGPKIDETIIIGVVKRWNNSLSMMMILRWANKTLREMRKDEIETIDIYAIIDYEDTRQKERDIESRSNERIERVGDRRLKSEMNLDQFRAFIFQWKRGSTFDQCMAAAGFSNAYFGRKCFSELQDRWKRVAAVKKIQPSSKKRVMIDVGKVISLSFRVQLNGMPYLCVPVTALPNEILESINRVRIYTPAVRTPEPIAEPEQERQPSPEERKEAISQYDETKALDELDEIAAEEIVMTETTDDSNEIPGVLPPPVHYEPLGEVDPTSQTDDIEI